MTDNPNQILEAVETFITQIDNGRGGVDEYPIYAGRTRVTAGHVIARTYPQYFRPIEEGLSYGSIEEMTDEPASAGRQRQVTPPAAAERSEQVAKAAAKEPAPEPPKAEEKSAEKSAEKPRVKAVETKGLTTKDLRPSGK